MFILEFFFISFLIYFQSIFGIGLLLLGTPTLLLFGYNFLVTLSILLPISIVISAIQFFSSSVRNKKFRYNFNFFCLPFLILSLYFIIKNFDKINLELYISILIIFFSVMSLNKKNIKYFKDFTLLKQRIFLSIIGVVHGLTNLGGPLLTILSSVISNQDKNKIRYFIAYGYLIMGIIQLLVLSFFSVKSLDNINLIYIALVFLIYFPAQKKFNNFNSKNFSNYLNISALIYGVIILLKNI
tara:strand:- start:294 stop:1016 length:723 start_codon:yes stop_codon:yes gene_type:complete